MAITRKMNPHQTLSPLLPLPFPCHDNDTQQQLRKMLILPLLARSQPEGSPVCSRLKLTRGLGERKTCSCPRPPCRRGPRPCASQWTCEIGSLQQLNGWTAHHSTLHCNEHGHRVSASTTRLDHQTAQDKGRRRYLGVFQLGYCKWWGVCPGLRAPRVSCLQGSDGVNTLHLS